MKALIFKQIDREIERNYEKIHELYDKNQKLRKRKSELIEKGVPYV